MRCHKCGAENKDGAEFCSECGTRLNKISHVPKKDEFEKENFFSHRAQVIILLSIIALLLLVILFLLLHTSANAVNLTTTVGTILPTTLSPKTLNPSNGTAYTGDVEYKSSTTLTGDVATSGQMVIDVGVALTTNGHSLFASGTFSNLGTINSGNPRNNAALGANGTSYVYSYGGSGGSGGGGGGSANAGSSAPVPKLTGPEIQVWHNSVFSSYLTGAGGGGGCPNNGYSGNGGKTLASGGTYSNRTSACTGVGGSGGSGSYGIYIQAQKIIAGTINANGQQGVSGSTDGGGGGGGGVIVLAYGSGGLTPGNYNVNGGASQLDGAPGGAGYVLNFSYGSSPPVTFSNT